MMADFFIKRRGQIDNRRTSYKSPETSA